MPEDYRENDKKRAAHQALVDRVLTGEGRAPADQRARAFGNDGLTPPLDTLIGKVATRPAQVTDADFTAAKAAGCSEDQLFELVVCAAVGQSARLYAAGLAALASLPGETPARPGGTGGTGPGETPGSPEGTRPGETPGGEA